MRLRSKEILIAYMNEGDWSVSSLAAHARCSRSMIGHLRSGEKTTCTPDLAFRVSEALGLDVEALFTPRPSATGGRYANERQTA